VERLSLSFPWREAGPWFAWELRRAGRGFRRRYGRAGVVLLLALAALCVAAWAADRQDRAARRLRAQWDDRPLRAAAVPAAAPGDERDGRARLKAFDDYLLAHDDIPTVVQDLLNQAEDQHLVLARGDYRVQADGPGGFLRYRMSLPVKGDAGAVLKLMQAALQSHKTLALESVQFKRARIDSPEVEARLQWVLLTQLPPGAASGPAR